MAFCLAGLLFIRGMDAKTDRLLEDENILPEIALIETIFPNEEINLKNDKIVKGEKTISLVMALKSSTSSSWVVNAVYEVTSLDLQPNLQEMYHYWNLREEDFKFYEDDKCEVYLLLDQELNNELTNCVVGKFNHDAITIYFKSYISEDNSKSEIIGEIEKMKKLFR